MKTKKVFSVEKFKELFEMKGYSKEDIYRSCAGWANKCDGLTEEEITSLGYVTNNEWMIEVKE